KLTKLIREDTKSAQYRCSEFSDYNNGGLEKRLEQIEAHLAKFVRKDTKCTKTPQRKRSESSPFRGLKKRLGQIKALLAKLAKDSKSRSGQVHMATADEQSNPIFSDDDTSKPEDNEYNSDNSSAEKKVNYAEQSGHSNKSSSSKINNGSKFHKVKQDNNSPSTCNISSEKGSQGTRWVSLEETIRKIIQ
ncbi:15343_t:CDS:2, partial [Funneliformis geosporum]